MESELNKNLVYDTSRGEKFIFLSYAHEQYEMLRADMELMAKYGVRLWFDTQLEYGDSWKKQVYEKMTMENCIGICCYLTENSVASDAVLWEIETALTLKKVRPSFSIYSVNAGGKSVFDILKHAENSIHSDKRETFYRTLLKAFDNESMYFSRDNDPTSKAHIHPMIKQFESAGARDTKINYSAPEEFSYIPFRDGIKITKYTGESAYPNVPAEIAGKRVLALGMEVFSGSPDLRSVALPEGIEEIGDRCFAECGSLEAVGLPVSVRHIAYEAFRGCGSLRSITFHKHVHYVGDYCFYLCKGLQSVTFDAACHDVTLGFNCFQECESLTEVTMPQSAAYIPMYCFNKCESLETLRMPAVIADMAETVVHNCPKLSRIVFPGELPAGYKGRIVMHCPSLKEFVCAKNDLPEAAQDALSASGAKVRILLPAPEPAFDENDMTVYFAPVKNASGYMILISEKVTSPKGQTDTVTTETAIDCTAAEKDGKKLLTFSARVEKTGNAARISPAPDNSAAGDCPSFTFRIRSLGKNGYENSDYSSECRFHNKSKDFVQGDDPSVLAAYNGTDKDVVIPDGFEIIGESAFKYRDDIRSVRLPYRVREIGNEAFYHCINLERIIWDEDSELEKIGAHAFAYCNSLGDIRFPSSLSEIGEGAFEVCPMMTVVDMSDSYVRRIGNSVFRRCIKLKTVKYSKNINTIQDKAFRGCTSLLPGTLPARLKSIGGSAFSFLMDAEEIVLPAGLRDVAGDFLFYSTGVKRIRFDGDPEYFGIDSETLMTKDGKTAVTFPINADVRDYALPAGTERIEPKAFRDIENMRTAVLGDELTEIGPENFSYCWSIERIVLGKNVKKIGAGCFSHNPTLREIVITSDTVPEADIGCFEKNSPDLTIVFGGKGYNGVEGKLSAWEYLVESNS